MDHRYSNLRIWGNVNLVSSVNSIPVRSDGFRSSCCAYYRSSNCSASSHFVHSLFPELARPRPQRTKWRRNSPTEFWGLRLLSFASLLAGRMRTSARWMCLLTWPRGLCWRLERLLLNLLKSVSQYDAHESKCAFQTKDGSLRGLLHLSPWFTFLIWLEQRACREC